MSLLIQYALSFLNMPYIWGGCNAEGVDCSGFVERLMKSVGLDPSPQRDTAQTLYNHFALNGKVGILGPGALCFYGKSSSDVEHIAFMVNDHQIVHAASGDHTCTDRYASARHNAFVRMDVYNYRSDFIGSIMPVYPDWLNNGDKKYGN